MQRSSTPLIIREMQIKMTMRCPFIPVRRAAIKKSTNKGCGETREASRLFPLLQPQCPLCRSWIRWILFHIFSVRDLSTGIGGGWLHFLFRNITTRSLKFSAILRPSLTLRNVWTRWGPNVLVKYTPKLQKTHNKYLLPHSKQEKDNSEHLQW